jgi:glycosyltransferase involved in cell wall biosynthesis
MRLAWFSPLPPSTSGIAAYSAELLPLLDARGHLIDRFTAANAQDFVWKMRRAPYDLVVYQLGNAACHDYMWAYLFHYRGMVVLHDAQLHQARALALTKRWLPRRDDYLAEFVANHPDAPPAIGDVVAAGFGQSLYPHWPHVRLVIESARLTIVHNRRLLADLRERYPEARLEAIEMGVADPLVQDKRPPEGGSHENGHQGRSALLDAHGIPSDAVVLAAFGGMTPEKRLPSLLRAVSALAPRHPKLHLLLVGQAATHYDVPKDAARWGIGDRVHVTGYVANARLPEYFAAADLCACLRWPTNRETSASWLRCLAAGRVTLISDLADLGDVPTLDPRGWRVLDTAYPSREPVAVSIDVVDEDHSLPLALDGLIGNAARCEPIARAARAWWAAHHQLPAMADAYERIMTLAASLKAPSIALPPHLDDTASAHGRSIAREMGVADRLEDILSERIH